MLRSSIIFAVLVCLAAPASAAEILQAEKLPADLRYGVPERWTTPGRPTVALALSGGGSRGTATVGALQAMLEDGVEFDAVAGTSIGSLIGSLLAGGFDVDTVEQIIRTKDWDSIVSGLDQRQAVLSRREEIYRNAQLTLNVRQGELLEVGSIAESGRLKLEMYRYLLHAQLESGGDFEKLHMPYRAVTTDILTGERFAPDRGRLVALVRGSTAIPGIFPPVRYDDRQLVDGMLVENLPVETARSFGKDLVFAVDVSEGIINNPALSGSIDVLNRSINVMADARNEEMRALADVALWPDVKDFPPISFGVRVDELLAEGRRSYAEEREATWKALEDAAGGPRLQIAGIEVEGTEQVDPEKLAQRIGLERGVSRYRLTAELTRLLNRGPFRSGHVELIDGARGLIARYVLQESARIRSVEVRFDGADAPTVQLDTLPVNINPSVMARIAGRARKQAIDRGRSLVQVDAIRWDPAEGRLQITLSEPTVARLSTAVEGEVRLTRAEKFLSALEGNGFTLDRLAARLDELIARGAIFDWTLRPMRLDGDSTHIEVELRGDDYYAFAAGGAYRGALEFAGFIRAAKSNFSGRGDFVDLTIAGSKDVFSVDARYRTEYGFGFQNLGAEVGARWFDNDFLVVDADQSLVDEAAEGYEGYRGWVSLIKRVRWGAVIQAGVFHESMKLDPTANLMREQRDRTVFSFEAELDRHDRLLFPEKGGALYLSAEETLDGFDLWKAELEGDLAIPLDRARRHVLTPRFGIGLSDGADRRPFWFDPGGFRSLYGFIPFGAAAPQYAHAGVTWRYKLKDIQLSRLYLEAGVDWIATSATRDTLEDASGTYGWGASLTANVKFLGPISLGFAGNETGADTVFVLVGLPWD
ncbi:hypothetical protein ABI59_20265 [Acidobacteria bacterium Mor1]|nr:hypothetical protein ABI59_20265 [Acidobacteria bacterium Mor1]